MFQWSGIQSLEKIIQEKNSKKPKIIRIEERNDSETKFTYTDKGPIFPYSAKENVTNFDQKFLV